MMVTMMVMLLLLLMMIVVVAVAEASVNSGAAVLCSFSHGMTGILEAVGTFRGQEHQEKQST